MDLAEVPLSHPLFLAERFNPNPFSLNKVKFEANVSQIAKLLAYGAVTRAKVRSGGNWTRVLEDELNLYPYNRREIIKESDCIQPRNLHYLYS